MLIEYLKVFLVGGIICLIAQIMMDYFKMQTPYVMVTYVTSGVILTFLGLYEPIVKFGGSGATVPIIGFGYSLAKGVIRSIETDGLLGVFLGGTTATAGGIAAAVFFGYIMAVVFTPKAKP
ncbi:stage V sporulation protein AE [Asaccharospora irregularis DSM 2635]|uniref:Stage V sporulation protein AE n=1 Tax=Asaccharospora irregularis DSM 2635 TaxID=1121321 RepID=A0A1M5JAL8_9FIRM|nr:stage V sporulation protein AE [Asaccharospora irregularis]SHG37614.1 stage V sporulation protein AE [Asaccharospora irregularis DSM 2635]